MNKEEKTVAIGISFGTFVLFMAIFLLAWGCPPVVAKQAPAWEKGDKSCLDSIEKAKRKQCFGCFAGSPGSKEFWSSHEYECYERIKNGKTGFRKRLEAAGYVVHIGDFTSWQCREYCHNASVSWEKIKDIGLTKAERAANAKEYLDDQHENASACGEYAQPGTKCDHSEEWDSIGKCLRRTGNYLRCHHEYWGKKNGFHPAGKRLIDIVEGTGPKKKAAKAKVERAR